jgi:hypothetical protein
MGETTMTRFKTAAALTLALAAALPLASTLASADAARETRRISGSLNPATAPFDAPAAIAAVYGAGYTALSELEWERGAWQAKAVDEHGRPARLRVDATTGAVSRRDR